MRAKEGERMQALSEFRLFGAFLVIGILLAVVALTIPLLIAPRSRGKKREETYECGVAPEGNSWMRFSLSFHLFALIFIAFEVDVLYLFPVAVAYGADGGATWTAFFEITLFLGILALAIVYAARRGVFRWR
jgi:NAD(P)H-quinone oxidoreductase subunit 3